MMFNENFPNSKALLHYSDAKVVFVIQLKYTLFMVVHSLQTAWMIS